MKDNDELILLGKRIRILRISKGYSQEGFAFSIDMNRGYYGAIERGEANVSYLNLLKIALGLGMSLSSLFSSDDYLSQNKTNISDIL